jgi:DNA-binding NtrC family response regulator
MLSQTDHHQVALKQEIKHIIYQGFKKQPVDRLEVAFNTCPESAAGSYDTIKVSINQDELVQPPRRLFQKKLISPPQSRCMKYPLDYRHHVVGHIALSLLSHVKNSESLESLLVELSHQVNVLIERFYFRQKVFNNTPEKLSWIGFSQSMRTIEDQVRQFAGVSLPVLIRAERGTGKVTTAWAIHNLSSRKEQPFVECCCLQLPQDKALNELQSCYKKAMNGTLFVRNINELDPDTLDRIRYFWEDNTLGQSQPVRIIASICQRHSDDNIKQTNAPWLTLFLPTLKERQRDIATLIQIYISKHALSNSIKLDDDCIKILQEYPWQDNARGLEKAIAILCVMTEQQQITKPVLLAILPELNDDKGEHRLNECHQNKTSISRPLEQKPESTPLAHLILKEELEELKLSHAAIRKSLRFIAKHYHERITLDDSAKQAYVSAPHLSYLYRRHLGTSFKKLVLEVRIEKAKQLLLEKLPLQVTQIAHNVGFHDLSHFEKTFRRLVGASPLKFRHHNC